jgi:DNA-binding CsgD family transcriptional regulator
MPHIDIELLAPFGAKFMEGTNLTPAERSEVLRMAQGFACKDSAAAAGVSPETIRARRKRIYRKIDMSGANELIAALLALSLKMLARGEKLEAARPPAPNPTPQVASDGQEPLSVAR